MINRRSFLAGSAGLVIGAGVSRSAMSDSTAQGGRLLYGYPPGASGSKLANALLPLIVAQGGGQYRLTNVEGHSTRAASLAAAKARPDGSVLLQAISASLTLMPSLHSDLGFDSFKDFKPIASLGDFPYALVVGPIVPNTVTNLATYLAWLDDNPEFRNIGISVNGSIGQVAVQALINSTGVPLHSQPYQGTVDLLGDLQSQSLAAAFVVPNPSFSPNTHNPIRPIGVTSAQRFSYWPSVASLAEQGISDMDLTAWFGWFTQSATPESSLTLLRAAIAKMQATIPYADALKTLILNANPLAPAQITARMHEEFYRYQHLVEKLRIAKVD